MADIYGGHLVAKYLREVEGVTTVFSLSGGHIDRIYDGFLDHRIRLIDVRHEQAAAMMAQAYAIYSGQPGVCLITAGPGFTNVITGLVNAYLENAPLVVLCGSAPLKDREKGALQDLPQADLIKSTVKWHSCCFETHRIPEYLAMAFRHAVSGRPGPVFLELPPDILNSSIPEEIAPMAPKGGVSHRSEPDHSLVTRAAELIASAEKPVVIGGSGIYSDSCTQAFAKFIKKTGLPFFLANNGRGALPDDHELSLWDGGLMGAITALGQADLVIALGVRFNWLLMYGEIFPQAKVIRVDIDPAEIDRNRQSDIGLVGDMELALNALHKRVKKGNHMAWRESLKELYQPLVQAEIDSRQMPSDPLHPARLVELVRSAVGDDAIYIVDGGDTSYFGQVGLLARERAAVIGSAGGLFGCLGTGIPFAIGAKAARPDKTVVVINGDGSFGFNAMEFDTAARHNLPIICVINNDQAWGMIKHGQEICYGNERVTGSELGVVHYEGMVAALGGHGEFVEREADVIPAMERALVSEKPACVNVLTDPCIVSPATLMLKDGLNMEK